MSNEPQRAGEDLETAPRKYWRRLMASAPSPLRQIRRSAVSCGAFVKRASTRVIGQLGSHSAAVGAFLSVPELLKWSEHATKSTATVYDRALDAEYLRTHVGGGYHRLFDGGHDFIGAWTRARDASTTDTLAQEVAGYFGALWKDLTTSRGLPFVSCDRVGYESVAGYLVRVPGISRAWLYKLVSYDAFEIVSTGVAAMGLIFALQTRDLERLSEQLGSVGTTALISANLLMGFALVGTTGFAYWQAKRGHRSGVVSGGAVARGAMLAGVSGAVFLLLGAHLIVELAVAVAVTSLLRRGLPKSATLDDAFATGWVGAQRGAKGWLCHFAGCLGSVHLRRHNVWVSATIRRDNRALGLSGE